MSKSEEEKVCTLTVGGMACVFCASTIENGLKKLNGVNSCKVILETGEVIVKYNPARLNEEIIRREIERLGYYVSEDIGSIFSYKILRENEIRSLISIAISSSLLVLMMVKPSYVLYVSLLIFLTSINLFYLAKPIHLGALYALRKKILNEHVLYGISSINAYILGVIGTLLTLRNLLPFFVIASILTSIHISSGWMGALIRYKADKSLRRALEIRPPMARVIMQNGEERLIPVKDVRIGDIVKVKPGERIPLDGIVIDGNSEVSEAMITGESELIPKSKGDYVIGGSTNGSGVLVIKVTSDYTKTYASRLLGLINMAKRYRSSIMTFYDKVISKYWVPFVIILTFAIFIIKLIVNLTFFSFTISPAFENAVVNALYIGVIGYPCAIGFTIPSAALLSFSEYMKKGILIKDINSLYKIKIIKTIIFDKTGTLTYGIPKVKNIVPIGIDEDELLQIVASVENNSIHPFSKAILDEAKKRRIRLLKVKEYREFPGYGIMGVLEDGREVLVGKKEFLTMQGVYVSETVSKNLSIIYIAVNKEHKGIIEIKDEIKDEALEIVKSLSKKYNLVLLSGDSRETVKDVCNKLKIMECYHGLSPEKKFEMVKKLIPGVAYIGDGINDAAAMTASDLGIAVPSSTDVTKNVADILILYNDLRLIPKVFSTSNSVIGSIQRNVLLAISFNIIGIGLALLGLLTPLIVMLIMALSLISVFSNAYVSSILLSNKLKIADFIKP
ncbi:MAG: cation-translocating P-type ATPase [Sulfolobaceae archaeon]|nr:cation-translocating P-type ATPase [Sulfolobaceae archaeon]